MNRTVHLQGSRKYGEVLCSKALMKQSPLVTWGDIKWYEKSSTQYFESASIHGDVMCEECVLLYNVENL